MTKKLNAFLTFFLLTSCTLLGFEIASGGKYSPPEEDIRKQVDYLEHVLVTTDSAHNDLWELNRQNPEWALFTLSYTTYAFTNIAINDSMFTSRAVKTIFRCISLAMDNRIKSPYGGWEIEPGEIESVLYLGHLNMMIGCYRLLAKDDTFNELHTQISEKLLDRFANSLHGFLESYPGGTWIPDNTAAVASIFLYERATPQQPKRFVENWISNLKENYTDSVTGLIYSTVNAETGKPLETPRGSMMGWTIFFLSKMDKGWARELYFRYKKKFSVNFMVFRLFKEHYRSYAIGTGDIDSGPLLLGFSIPANAFAYGSSVLFGDDRTAKKLRRLVNFGTREVEEDGFTHYKPFFVNFEISPMAEAILLFSETMTDWTPE